MKKSTYQLIRVAQRKRGGPITHRSQDRNLALIKKSRLPLQLLFFFPFPLQNLIYIYIYIKEKWNEYMSFVDFFPFSQQILLTFLILFYKESYMNI